ncbi:MAG: helix-turn-helix domain-containing protein [Bacteroidetes bacterium]|nr:helix-turn-helix domain-containing protein [Bacteroidota bacterium]
MKKIPIRAIKDAENSFNPLRSFSIRELDEVLAGRSMEQDLHRHSFFFILAVRTGTGSHEIDFTSYKVKDRTVFLVRPGQVHQLSLTAGSTGYVLQFSADLYSTADPVLHRLVRSVSHTNRCQLSEKAFEKIAAILGAVREEYRERAAGYEDIIRANLSIFFTELLRHASSANRPAPSATHYAQQRLDELFELLEAHIATRKRVAEYAELLHLSAYQLNAVTKATLGKTCSELINEQIVLEAKRHLLSTSERIKEIAVLLGYEDLSYFIRFFRKHTGYTPEAFRQKFR